MSAKPKKRGRLWLYALGMVVILPVVYFFVQPMLLMWKYSNLRSRSDAPEIGTAMARLALAVSSPGYVMRDDPRFPTELKRIGADRVFVSPNGHLASVYFGYGFYGFGYRVGEREDAPGVFLMRAWSDTDDNPPSWEIRP